MKLFKITGNYGWLLYAALEPFDLNSAENVYKNHFGQLSIMTSSVYMRIDYPYVLLDSKSK